METIGRLQPLLPPVAITTKKRKQGSKKFKTKCRTGACVVLTTAAQKERKSTHDSQFSSSELSPGPQCGTPSQRSLSTMQYLFVAHKKWYVDSHWRASGFSSARSPKSCTSVQITLKPYTRKVNWFVIYKSQSR